ncbi:relaxase [Pseudomonas aeruginosa]|uniref:MobH family relaxase n=1 Tax=Pseudomonas aeruginosa TaxID=287 RepID=UPI00071B29B9|nr:MobH family relaxase [Pseudomonas aeruginosa]KSQ25794.1 relaxase [Pseudomonas aeruginosa]MCO1686938.1 relaxase [Pseudomonas aeruginosa]MCO1780353.1 relaxase [Pseudomonas aeruginosa]MCO1790161.1 relaxase [Pseudomonas aeruginosa]MCO1799199.1 relaxase [Pseudomonas aeruginosa]
MLALFQQKRPSPTAPPTGDKNKGLMRPEPATALLSTPRRQLLLEHIWQRTALSRKQFASLYLAPLERYAGLVQQFPASESHHHAYPGGMLDHGLEIVAYALKLRQPHLLPTGSSPEDQVVQAEAWSAGIAYAALLHDIGKIAVDLYVEYNDGSCWHPWHGPLIRPYRFRYRQDREYRLHSAATGLLYRQVLDGEILDWLSTYPPLWSALLYVLAGQYEHAGVLGELVVQADRASVAQALGGDPARAMAAPRHALQRKVLDGLRYLLKEELKLNQAGPADGWLTEDTLWLVSKTVSDKLRAYLLSQGIEGIPTNNTAVFNVLQDHGMLQPTPDGKAIWRATVMSTAGWSHTFTFLRLAPALIWEGGDRPAPFTGSVVVELEPNDAPAAQPTKSLGSSPTADATPERSADPAVDSVEALLALLGTSDTEPPPQDQEVEPPPAAGTNELPVLYQASDSKPPPVPVHATIVDGEHFMTWLQQRIQSRRLIINDARALVHTVANTVFLVSPGVFQRYAQEHPQTATLAKQDQIADWQWVQKRFEKLQLHRKQDNGLNIWTCEVTGPRKSRRLHGYLLTTPRRLFDVPPPNNPYLILLTPQ